MSKVRVGGKYDRQQAVMIRRAALRLGLDRRKVYVLDPLGHLATAERFTTRCSGCACDCSDSCAHGSSGCRECGYTGKRVTFFAVPVTVGGEFVVPHEAAQR